MVDGGIGSACILEQDINPAVTESHDKRPLELAQRTYPAWNNRLRFNKKINITATLAVIDARSEKPDATFASDNTGHGGFDRLTLIFS
jgi:hypothetical protein